jgi:hypothetical protein
MWPSRGLTSSPAPLASVLRRLQSRMLDWNPAVRTDKQPLRRVAGTPSASRPFAPPPCAHADVCRGAGRGDRSAGQPHRPLPVTRCRPRADPACVGWRRRRRRRSCRRWSLPRRGQLIPVGRQELQVVTRADIVPPRGINTRPGGHTHAIRDFLGQNLRIPATR